jgi:hypothetical protein
MLKYRLTYSQQTLAALLVYLGITIFFMWPLIFNLLDQLSGVGDTYEYVWRLWWIKYTLIDTAQSPWQVPFIYYPHGYPLAYSEVTPTNTIVGLPFTLAFGEFTAHNILLFLSIFLTAFNTFLLARELTGSWWAGLLAGILFGLAPYRRGQFFHLNQMAVQWFPLIFLFLDRFLRTFRWRYAFAGGLVFGFNALASWYFALAGGLLSLVWLAWRARPWSVYLSRRRAWLGLTIFAVTAGLMVLPFLPPFWAVNAEPDTRATLDNVNFWSASPTDYLIPNPFHPLWGSWIEEKLMPLFVLVDSESPTQADFAAGKFYPNSNQNIATEFLVGPGIVAALMAFYGLRWAAVKDTRPWLYLTLVALILSFGLTLHLAGRQVIIPVAPAIISAYNQVMNYLSLNLSLQPEPFSIGQDTGILIPLPALLLRWFVPAIGNVRTWTRFGMFVIFGMSILAAYGATAWHRREIALPKITRTIPSKFNRSRFTIHNSPFTIYTLPWLILVGLALFEVWWKPMPTHPPFTHRPVDSWLRQQPSHNPLNHNPVGWSDSYCDETNLRRQPDNDAIVQYPLDSSFNGVQFIYTRAHCKPMVHAYGNFFGFMIGRRHPPLLTFPTAESLVLLSEWGVRYVLIETAGPGTASAPELLQKVANVPCLHPATVQGSVHVFELINCQK